MLLDAVTELISLIKQNAAFHLRLPCDGYRNPILLVQEVRKQWRPKSSWGQKATGIRMKTKTEIWLSSLSKYPGLTNSPRLKSELSGALLRVALQDVSLQQRLHRKHLQWFFPIWKHLLWKKQAEFLTGYSLFGYKSNYRTHRCFPICALALSQIHV